MSGPGRKPLCLHTAPMRKFASMGGEAGAARQLAGLLRGGGGDLAAQRVARLVAEACAGVEPAESARQCAALRDSILQLCEDGTLTPTEARLLCREIDGAQAAMLDALSSPHRVLDALERALSDTPARDLPELVVQGALSADSAALLIGENGKLVIRATAGLEIPPDAADPRSVAHRALAEGSVVEASDTENARAVLAFPLQFGDELLGVLRVSSRTAWKYSDDEKRFLRAIATRAATLLAGDDPQARLRHTLRTFESLIEASPLPILSVDRNGFVQIWNRAAEELFGWQRHEVVGKATPLGSHDLEEALRIRQEIDDGRVIRNQEVRWQRKDGTHLDLALSAAPLRDPAGAVSGSIAILVDITDRKQREEQVVRTARFREHFVGIVSHDLRNPLTAIVTSAQLLLRYGELPERQARVVARIAASADRMARMIDDLLDFARSRLGGEFPIHPRRIDLRQICEQTVEELEFAYTRQVKLEVHGDPWGDWDPDRMAQVISNLVGNAVQHSEGDVEVTLRGESDFVVLETHNRGTPIPREVLPHVFEPGRRGTDRSGGLGLGLFIVQQIVLAHGGSIEVSSSESDGTTFTVALPRKGRQKP
jgi:PAS domain S-box-containing protein